MSDVLVVGSGAGAVNAAWPLVEAGLSVELLDYGNRDRVYAPLVPARPWSEIRRSDPEQHRYLLGERFEGIPLGPVRVGAQLTPPRAHVTADAERRTPVDAAGFGASESLARGGLASAWGAGVFPFGDEDLRGTPLARSDLERHYAAVAERIGVSGPADDDLAPFLGPLEPALPPLELDSAAERVMERYARRRGSLRARGFALGATRLAACTREHRGRGPYRYLDLDFWADPDRSVWRPRFTLEELQQNERFRLSDRRFVQSFRETGDGVEVVSTSADLGDGGGREVHRARALVLAAGALGSARIVLRSLGRYDEPVPLCCNPYRYVPVLNLGMLGREARDRRHGLAQLTALFRRGGREVVAQYYSYRSLLTFKLLKEAPLAHRDALRILRALLSAIGILGIHHADHPSPERTCALRRDPAGGPDRLEIRYGVPAEEERLRRADERALLGCFRRLGLLPLKRIDPGPGASIHYAGTLPFREEGDGLGCDERCRLHGTRAVHLADGSVFPSLPARGLTFTLMANANRVGTLLAEELS